MWQFIHTPAAPDFHVDWNAICGTFVWIKAMQGVQQNPEWHAEGDVFIHTGMVAQAIASLPKWRGEGALERDILFSSALLHDVAKPQCTIFDQGRWTSPKHTRVGEQMARTLLWRGEAGSVPPFAVRERITKLVRYHGLPLQFLNKPDPIRAVVEASHEVDLLHLAQLATADVIGRECRDKQALLDTIGMFAEFCSEQNCFGQPFPFQAGMHRFMYCVGRKPLEYVPFDDTWGEVIVMCGLPGSGKSSAAAQMAQSRGIPILALDDFREKLGISPEESQGAVVNACEAAAIQLLRAKKPFIWDGTNVFRDVRSSVVAMFAKYGASVRIVYVEAPSWKEMFERNKQRERTVPEGVITRLAEKLEMPSPNEAPTVEYVV